MEVDQPLGVVFELEQEELAVDEVGEGVEPAHLADPQLLHEAPEVAGRVQAVLRVQTFEYEAEVLKHKTRFLLNKSPLVPPFQTLSS